MIATWKLNEHKFKIKKFQNWIVFGLKEIEQTFWYEIYQILMIECAFHFCGRRILITTVFHIPKSISAGGIANFFRVCFNIGKYLK
jgi:hypothetical protein